MIALFSCAGHAGSDDALPKSSSDAKLDSALVRLMEEYRVFQKDGQKDGLFKSSEPGIRIVSGRLIIDAIASGDADVLRHDLAALSQGHNRL